MDDPVNEIFDGRYVRCWTQEQISFLSDVIASATLLQTERLEALEGFEKWEGVGVRAVEMTFSVSRTFKGKVPPDSKIVVRYYEPPGSKGPESWIETDAEATQTYLLYLLQEANNRFAPTSGSMEPRMCIRAARLNVGQLTASKKAAGTESEATGVGVRVEPPACASPAGAGQKAFQANPP